MASDPPLRADTAHAGEAADNTLVLVLLNQLQRAAARLSPHPPAAQLRGILAAHGLEGGFHRSGLPNEATWWVLLRHVASWCPEAACLLGAAALAHEAGLPASAALLLQAGPDNGYWRMDGSRAESASRWHWFSQDALWSAPTTAMRAVGLGMHECRHDAALRERPASARELRWRGTTALCLHQGAARAALATTRSHLQERIMFHRPMLELPAIAWRLQRCEQWLVQGRLGLLRLELEQLLGGTGFMAQTRQGSASGWLLWAEDLAGEFDDR